MLAPEIKDVLGQSMLKAIMISPKQSGKAFYEMLWSDCGPVTRLAKEIFVVSERHLLLLDRLKIKYKVIDLNSVGKGKGPHRVAGG